MVSVFVLLLLELNTLVMIKLEIANADKNRQIFARVFVEAHCLMRRRPVSIPK